jgi:hypothetical protein
VLHTSNGEPQGSLYAGRLPREIWVHAPGVGPLELLSIHLAKRERVAAAAGLLPPPIGSGEQCLARELEIAAQRTRLIRRRNAWFFLLRVDLFNRRPKMEWGAGDRQ